MVVLDTVVVRGMVVVQDMGDMITTVDMVNNKRRRRTKVQVLTIMVIQWVHLGIIHIRNQQLINIEIQRMRNQVEIIIVMRIKGKKRGNLKYRFKLKNLLEKLLLNCLNLERKKFNLLLLIPTIIM